MPVFPEREIADHGVPVTPAVLVVGETYFQATFIDNAMLVPELRPVVFLGSDLPAYGEGQYAFQDAWSYAAGISPDEAPVDDPVRVDLFDPDGLGSVYAFDAALDVLLRCALRRGSVKPDAPSEKKLVASGRAGKLLKDMDVPLGGLMEAVRSLPEGPTKQEMANLLGDALLLQFQCMEVVKADHPEVGGSAK